MRLPGVSLEHWRSKGFALPLRGWHQAQGDNVAVLTMGGAAGIVVDTAGKEGGKVSAA